MRNEYAPSLYITPTFDKLTFDKLTSYSSDCSISSLDSYKTIGSECYKAYKSYVKKTYQTLKWTSDSTLGWGDRYENNVTTASSIVTSYFDWISVTATSQLSFVSPPVDPIVQLKQRIQRQLSPSIIVKNADLMGRNTDPAERVARELLCDMIGVTEFKRYLIRGFITVKGRTGMIYKISGGHEKIACYAQQPDKKYKLIETICIIFKKEMPWTDSVVMRKLLIENDEFGFRKLGNVFKIGSGITFNNANLMVG